MEKGGLVRRGTIIVILLALALLLFVRSNSPTGLQTFEDNKLPVYSGGVFTAAPLSSVQVNLSDYFSDPQNDSLSFVVQGENVSIEGALLTFASNTQGENFVTVVVSDGTNTLYKQLTFIVNGSSEYQPIASSDDSTEQIPNETALSSPSEPVRSASMSRSILAAPSIAQVILNSSDGSGAAGNNASTDENLTVVIINATDADSDPVQNITDWRLNGTSIALLNAPFESNISSTAVGAIRDYSQSGNNGTLGAGSASLAPAWNASGKAGGAFTFDGVNDAVNFSNSSTLRVGTRPFSLEVWVLSNPAAGFRSIINKFNPVTPFQDVELRIAANDTVQFIASDCGTPGCGFSDVGGGGTRQPVGGTSNISEGVFHHVVGVRRSNGTLEIYVDGVRQNTRDEAVRDTDSIGHLFVGDSPGGGLAFKGSVDEFRVWNHSLSAAQIYQLYLDGNNSRHMESLHFNETVVGDTWSVAVTPNDRTEDGTTRFSNNVTIVNAAPSIAQVILNSSDGSGATGNNATTDENLTVVIINATDVDGEAVQNITDWRLNGTSIAVLNMPFETNVSSNSSGAVRDYSQFGNNGTLGNGTASKIPVWNSSGKVGGAYTFDGLNDSILVGNNTGLALSSFTIAAWVRTNSSEGAQAIVERAPIDGATPAFSTNYRLQIFGGQVMLFMGNGTGSQNTLGTTNVSTGSFAFVVGTFNNVTRNMSVYVNGLLENSTTFSGTLSSSGSQFFAIGSASVLTALFFNGTIDEVAIFNRTLSAAQIYQLYFDGNRSKHMETLHFNETTVGQNWSVAVTPNDNQNASDGSTVLSNNVTILSAAPSIAQVILNSSDGSGATGNNATTDENLTVVVINATDPDNMSVQNITDWRLNGTSIALMNLPFETNTSSTAAGALKDYSQFGNNGTLGNGTASQVPAWNASGRAGSAYTFDAVDDFIDFGDVATMETAGARSIEAWIRTNSTGSLQVIYSKYREDTAEDGWFIGVLNTGHAVAIVKSTGAGFTIFSGTNVSDGQLHHIVATWNTSGVNLSLYVDGVRENQSAVITGTFPGNTRTVMVGNMHKVSSANLRFNGTIDEVRFYNRTISAAQVYQLFLDGNRSRHMENLHFNETNITDVWSVAVTPNDNAPNTDGTTRFTNNVTILNAAPSIAQVILNSTDGSGAAGNNASTNENLSVVIINATDVDGQQVQNITDWRLNGTSIAVLNLPFESNISSNASRAIRDYSQFANNGTSGNGTGSQPVWNASGKVGGAYTFDGLNDIVEVNDSSSLDLLSTITMAAWVHPVSDSAGAPDVVSMIVNKEVPGGANSFEISRKNSVACVTGSASAGTFLFFLGNITGPPDDCSGWTSSLASLPLNMWSHVALTYSGSAVSTYVNGSLTRSIVANGTLRQVDGPVKISGRGDPDPRAIWNGSIDEVLIFNRSLSAAQVAQLYQDGLSNLHSAVLRHDETSVGDIWSVAVTPNDNAPNTDGSTVLSNNVTIVADEVVVCPLNITSSTILTENVTCPATAINILASDLVLDCAGFTVTYGLNGSDSQPGIVVSNQRNVTVKNCIILDGNSSGSAGYGLRLTSVNASHITNNTIQTNGTDSNVGISIQSSANNNTIANNTINAQGTASSNLGIYLFSTVSGNTVTNNTIRTNGTDNNYGIIVQSSANNNTITNNTINARGTTTSNVGIFLVTTVSGNAISGNTIQTNGTSSNYGISLQTSANNNTVSNNSIRANGTSSGNDGVALLSGSINNTIENNAIIADAVGSVSGVRIESANNTLRNNTIVSVGTLDGVGVFLVSSAFNTTVMNNSITTSASGNSYGISVSSGLDNLIVGNNVSAGTSSTSAHGIFVSIGSSMRFINNTVNATGDGLRIAAGSRNNFTGNVFRGVGLVSAGMRLTTGSSLNRFNNDQTNGSSSAGALVFTSSHNNTFINLTAYNNVGLDGSSNNSLINSTIVTPSSSLNAFSGSTMNNITGNMMTAAAGHAIVLSSDSNFVVQNTLRAATGSAIHVGAHNNSIEGNTLSTNTGRSINIVGAENNSFINNVLETNVTWIETDAASLSNSLARTTFNNSVNGSILIINSTAVPISTVVNLVKLRTRLNNSFLNSSNLSFLNTSAQITLRNLTFSDPRPLVDFEDDGSFALCDSPQCVEDSYSGGTFVFNVSSFTSYSTQESSVCPLNITSSTILTENVTCPATAIDIQTDNVTLDCAGFTIRWNQAGASSTFGVLATGRTNVTVRNCILLDVNSSGATAAGIYYNRTNQSRIVNVTIQANGTSENAGVLFERSSANNVENSTVRLSGTGSLNDGIRITQGANNTVNNNGVTVSAAFFDNGIEVDDDSFGNNVTRNTVNVTGGDSERAVRLNNNASFNLVAHNALGVSGTTNTIGILANNAAPNNTLWNNTVNVSGITGFGISVQAGSNGTRVQDSFVNITIASGFALRAVSSVNMSVVNTTLESSFGWIDAGAAGPVNLTNVSFQTGNGSIRIGNATVPANITRNSLNVSLNNSFLNSSNLSFLNTSAQITLRNLTFANPRPVVDFNDDGLFALCSPPQCVEDLYSGGVFVFNVSSFTSYAAAESVVCPLNITTSTTLTENIICPATAINILADDVTLDCAGFTVTYDANGSNGSVGVNAISRNNITIGNCIIQDGNASGSSGHGIHFRDVANSNVTNNSIQTNGTTLNHGMFLASFSTGNNGNNITGNTIRTTGSSIQNSGIHIDSGTINLIRGNIISTNGTGGANDGIFAGTNLNIMLNNTITAQGRGIVVTGSHNLMENNTANASSIDIGGANNTVKRNTVEQSFIRLGNFVQGIPNFVFLNTIILSANALGGIRSDSAFFGNIVANNTINMTGGGTGFYLVDSNNFTIENNTVSVNGTSNNNGLHLDRSSNNTVRNNVVVANGTGGANYAMVVSGANNTVTGNVLVSGAGSGTNAALRMLGSSIVRVTNNTIIQNTITSFFGSGVRIDNTVAPTNTTLRNNTFVRVLDVELNIVTEGSNGTALVDQPIGNYSIIDSTIIVNDTSFGSIRYTSSVNESGSNLSRDIIIQNNRTFVNTSGKPGFNESAQITLRALPFIDPRPVVDFNDDGVFAPCGPPQCVEDSYSGGVFVFNVSSFTSYAASSTIAPNIVVMKSDSPDPVNANATLTYTIVVNNTGDDTAFNVTVLDTYPVQVEFNGSSIAPSSGNDTFLLGNFSPNQSFTLIITVNVSSNASGTLTNTVTVNFTNSSGQPSNSSASASTTVTPPPSPFVPSAGGGLGGGAGAARRGPAQNMSNATFEFALSSGSFVSNISEGGTFAFIVDGAPHTLTVEKVSGGQAVVSVDGAPGVNLSEADSVEGDLDGDGVSDVRITLQDVMLKRVVLSVLRLEKPAFFGNIRARPESVGVGNETADAGGSGVDLVEKSEQEEFASSEEASGTISRIQVIFSSGKDSVVRVSLSLWSGAVDYSSSLWERISSVSSSFEGADEQNQGVAEQTGVSNDSQTVSSSSNGSLVVTVLKDSEVEGVVVPYALKVENVGVDAVTDVIIEERRSTTVTNGSLQPNKVVLGDVGAGESVIVNISADWAVSSLDKYLVWFVDVSGMLSRVDVSRIDQARGGSSSDGSFMSDMLKSAVSEKGPMAQGSAGRAFTRVESHPNTISSSAKGSVFVSVLRDVEVKGVVEPFVLRVENTGVDVISEVVLEEHVFMDANVSSITRVKESLGDILAGESVVREIAVDSLVGLGGLRYIVRFVNGSGDVVAIDAGRIDERSVSDVKSRELPQAKPAGGPSGFVVVTSEGELVDVTEAAQQGEISGASVKPSIEGRREYRVWLRQSDNAFFTLRGVQYKLTIQRISAGKVLIHIAEYPREFLLMNGEKGYMDIGSDGVYDAKIEIVDVSSDGARISLLRFYE